MRLRLSFVSILFGGVVFAAAEARADLINNGSFENTTGATIDNWTLTPSAASGVSSSYTGVSPYGPKFLAFNPLGALIGGSATQDFGVTTLNQEYTVSFAYGQINTGANPDTQNLLVTINNTSAPSVIFTHTYTDDTSTSDLSTVWNRATFTFIGIDVPTGITFADTGTLTGINSDLLVDDVSILATPEPSSALVSTGIGAIALMRRRARKRFVC